MRDAKYVEVSGLKITSSTVHWRLGGYDADHKTLQFGVEREDNKWTHSPAKGRYTTVPLSGWHKLTTDECLKIVSFHMLTSVEELRRIYAHSAWPHVWIDG